MAQTKGQIASKQPQKATISDLAKAEERTAWWLLAPSLVILAVIAVFPLGQVFVSSFTNARFASDTPTEFVGFANYSNLLSFTIRAIPFEVDSDTGERTYENSRLFLRRLGTDRSYDRVREFGFLGNRYVFGATNARFINAIIDTIVFTVVAVFLETIFGMVIALALTRKFFGRSTMRTAMLVPWAIITVVSALIWEWMFKSDRSGFFNSLLTQTGLADRSIGFLTEPALQLPSIIAVDVWKTTPFMALLLLAGLSTIPRELYEAAEVDGATRFRRFFSVTLPLLSPTLAVALIFRTLDSLRVFDLFQVVFGERRYSMASFAQDMLISNRNVGLSSASSVVIFIIIFAFALFYIRILGVDSE